MAPDPTPTSSAEVPSRAASSNRVSGAQHGTSGNSSERLREIAHFYLGEDRLRVVVVGDK